MYCITDFLLENVTLTLFITPFPAYSPKAAPLGICFNRTTLKTTMIACVKLATPHIKFRSHKELFSHQSTTWITLQLKIHTNIG